MPYSAEITGNLEIANHDVLVANQNERFDIVIAETKSGNDNKPNLVWRNKVIPPIKYIVRFIGLYDNDQIDDATDKLASCYCYENGRTRIRYIVFANEPNQHYVAKGVKYITFQQITKFLVETCGQCRIEFGIGVASVHYQWDEQINKIFDVANNMKLSLEARQSAIIKFLFSNGENAA